MVEITSFYLIGYSNEHLEEHAALLYIAGHLGGGGGWCAVSSQVCPGQSPGGDQEKFFCLCLQNYAPGKIFLLMPTK